MMSASSAVVARLLGLLVGLVMAASPGTALAADPVVAAAGDIACDHTDPNHAFNNGNGSATECRQRYTSDLLAGYDRIITLGDNQYGNQLSNFQSSYALSWGRAGLFEKTNPAIGNHEGTTTASGAGYCSYFGPAAHCNASGTQGNAAYYSWDIGTWHVIALNSNCVTSSTTTPPAVSCGVDSPMYAWLQQDLAQSPARCTLAYWHHPRWSSGHDGSNAFMQPFWKLLYDNGADLVLSGHSHSYERFAPLDGDGALNPSDGMRQFVVGTGGAFFTGLGSRIANSEAGQNSTFGVLGLTLRPTGYDFAFVAEAGAAVPYSDAGSGTCRGEGGGGGDTSPPSAPGTPTSTVTATTATLSWTASSDNVGVTGYRVFRDGAQVATTPGDVTTLNDTGLLASTTYSYTVQAVDAAGHMSAPSGALSVTTSPASSSATLTFPATDDATIDAANPTRNLGATSRITVDSSPVNDMLLKFAITGTGSGTSCPTIASAKLRLTVGNTTSDNAPSGGDFRAAVSSAWSESTVTYNNAPAAAGPPAASITTPVALGRAYIVDITTLVNANGPLTIRAAGRSSDGARYYSRNTNPANLAPELQITCG